MVRLDYFPKDYVPLFSVLQWYKVDRYHQYANVYQLSDAAALNFKSMYDFV